MSQKYPIPDIGQTFGYWTIIDNNIQRTKKHGAYVLAKCKCGHTKECRVSTLYRGESVQCLACRGNTSSKNYFQGVGHISQTYFYRIKNRAENKNLEFNITKDYLWDLFLEQNKKCALSGVDLKFYTYHKNKTEQTASVDRKDSNKGYIEGNVQWVHKAINKMKGTLNDDEFVQLCDLISQLKQTEPRVRIVARTKVEGIHRWAECPIEEVSYLRNYHRHVFHVAALAYVSHQDRDIEFIQLSHNIKNYLFNKYHNSNYGCLFFGDMSCEMLADELVNQFGLYECEVNEDGEGGSVVRKY